MLLGAARGADPKAIDVSAHECDQVTAMCELRICRSEWFIRVLGVATKCQHVRNALPFHPVEDVAGRVRGGGAGQGGHPLARVVVRYARSRVFSPVRTRYVTDTQSGAWPASAAIVLSRTSTSLSSRGAMNSKEMVGRLRPSSSAIRICRKVTEKELGRRRCDGSPSQHQGARATRAPAGGSCPSDLAAARQSLIPRWRSSL